MESLRTVKLPIAFTVRLPEPTVKQLQTLAERDDRPPSAFARRLLINAVAQLETETVGTGT